MAKVTRITASFSGTIPTQQYGNIVIGGVWEAELEPGDDPRAVQRQLQSDIRDEIRAAMKPVAAAKAAQQALVLDMLPPESRKQYLETFGVGTWLDATLPELHFAAPAPQSPDTNKPKRMIK